MPITVECPACEQVFRVSSKYRNRKGRCPLCDCSFIADESVITSVTETVSSSSRSAKPASIPIPSALRNGKQTTLPPVPHQLSDSGEEIEVDAIDLTDRDDSVNDHSFTDAATQSLIAQEMQFKKPMSSTTIGILGTLLFASGVGIAFVVFSLTGREKIAQVNDQQNTPAKTDEVRIPEKKTGDRAAAVDKAKIHDDEKPTSLSIDQLHRVWSSVSPYLVRLDITTPSGTVTATGIIVDSRGWIATSYSAIKDAVRIKTTLAASQFDDGPATKELFDAVRGLIVADPKHDIALLAANRSLGLSVTDIPMDSQKSIVGSQQIIVCRVPGDGRRLWITDSKVDRRPSQNELEPGLQQSIKKFGFEVDAKFRWIVHRRPFQPQLAGSALLDRNGNLIGMGTMWNVGSDESFSIPIEKVIELRDLADAEKRYENLKPLPKTGVKIANTNSKTGPNGKHATVNPESPDAVFFKTHNAKLDVCQAFGWLASDESEAKQLVAMAKQFTAAPDETKKLIGTDQQRTEAESRFMSIFETVQKQIDGIEKLPPAEVAKSNQLILDHAKDKQEAPLVLMATVYRPSIFGPTVSGKKTVMFKIEGTDDLLITTAAENHFELRPGTRWLIMGHVHKNRSMVVTNSRDEKEQCLRAVIKFAFEVVD